MNLYLAPLEGSQDIFIEMHYISALTDSISILFRLSVRIRKDISAQEKKKDVMPEHNQGM